MLKIVKCDISATVTNLIKFGSTMHRSISHPNLTGDQMFKIFENPRLWKAAILKIAGLHADCALAADVSLVGGRILSQGSVRYGTSANVDAVLE